MNVEDLPVHETETQTVGSNVFVNVYNSVSVLICNGVWKMYFIKGSSIIYRDTSRDTLVWAQNVCFKPYNIANYNANYKNSHIKAVSIYYYNSLTFEQLSCYQDTAS